MTFPIDPTMLAAILQSNAPTALGLPVSAISQAPEQLAAEQSGGINNIAKVLNSMGAAPTAAQTLPASPTSNTGGLMDKLKTLKERKETVDTRTPQHHALVASNAQYVPLEGQRTNPYAPVAPSNLFDMLQSMYGA